MCPLPVSFAIVKLSSVELPNPIYALRPAPAPSGYHAIYTWSVPNKLNGCPLPIIDKFEPLKVKLDSPCNVLVVPVAVTT